MAESSCEKECPAGVAAATGVAVSVAGAWGQPEGVVTSRGRGLGRARGGACCGRGCQTVNLQRRCWPAWAQGPQGLEELCFWFPRAGRILGRIKVELSRGRTQARGVPAKDQRRGPCHILPWCFLCLPVKVGFGSQMT